MTNDVFAAGFQRWEARFAEANADSPPFFPGLAREVTIAADLCLERERHGERALRAVDLGAGAGRHTIYLASRGFHVLSVDAAPSGIELIRDRLERESLSAELVVADLRDYTMPSHVDLLVASYVIHMLPDPLEHLRRWREAVRPGGVLSIGTRGRFATDPQEFWFPDDFELKRLFEEAGWFVLHTREEENWREAMGIHFRQRAAVAIKPEQE